MRRRDLLRSAAAVAAWPFAAHAQQPSKLARIGWISALSAQSSTVRDLLGAFRKGMQELGYIEGENFILEYRSVEGRLDRLRELTNELVQLKVDLIVAGSSAAVRGAKEVTATIPIICFTLGDPVADGLVASLAQPGGNVTGYSILAPELPPKQLDLLKQAAPRISRVGGLWQPGILSDLTATAMLQKVEAAARTLDVAFEPFPVANGTELDLAFTQMRSSSNDALLIFASPLSLAERHRISDFASRNRLPSIGWIKEFVQAGSLMSYGVDFREQYRRGALYVDRVLRGAQPATLPIQQPTSFELVINMRAARALSLSISSTMLALADEVVE